MTVLRRFGILLLWLAAALLANTATGYVAGILNPRLNALVPGRWLEISGHEPGFAFNETAFLLATLLPLLFWKKLRDAGTLRLRRSWTLLLILPSALVNLVFFCGWPALRGAWPRALCLAWGGLATGAAEEWWFRGYMFHDRPQAHPRFVIGAAALLFALMHLLNLRASPLSNVLVEMLVALVLGFGFGIVRLVSGSLGWCILVHGLVDASFYFTVQNARYHVVSAIELLIVCLVTPVVLWRHPSLRPASKSVPDHEMPSHALQADNDGSLAPHF